MATKIKCGKCEAKFSVKDAAAGRRVKCRECGAPIKVPVPKTDEDGLLDFDAAAYGDDSAGDAPYGGDASTGTQPLPRRRRKKSGSKRAAASGGKKSSGSKSGLIIGLSAGGGLLVIALLAMMFWPETPRPEVADASDGENVVVEINDPEPAPDVSDASKTAQADVVVEIENPEPAPDAQNSSTPAQADAVVEIKNLGGRVSLGWNPVEVVSVSLSDTQIAAENRQFPRQTGEIKRRRCETLVSHKSRVSRRFEFGGVF